VVHATQEEEEEEETDLEGAHERLVYTHHGSSVVKLSAVVRSRE